MKVYLGGPMFILADKEYNLRLAAKVRALGFDVYCPNESEPINDKSRNDITARRVYEFDIEALESSNVQPVQELIDLITTQRAFELNSQVVQAGDQVMQTVANMRRY